MNRGLKWGKERFVGLQDNLWWDASCGPKRGLFTENSSSATVFDALWSGCSESLLISTNSKEEQQISLQDLNLYLAGLLVTGLSPQPAIEDYFTRDPSGISGNLWMQQHFTEHIWCHFNAHTHIDGNGLISLLRDNAQKLWNLHQHVVVDEMMVPFTGRWKYRQHVKGKPHDTGETSLVVPLK
jgi:hypothetical protein